METFRGTTRILWVGDEDETEGPTPASFEAVDDDLTVVEESDFRRSLERIRSDDVDCVVSDHRRGGIDGLALLEAVRSDRPTFPFVLVPTDGGDQVASRAVEADVTAYIPPGDEGVARRAVEQIRQHLPSTGDSDGNGRTPVEGENYDREFRLKEMVLDEAPLGITIADAERPDNPLVYANDSFAELTGYDIEEILGSNCRFLQGEHSDPEKIAEMRRAIEAETDVTVRIRNYRKDGSEFWNRVNLSPIRGPDGDVTHYAGFQTDITETRRIQRQLDSERSALRRVLERLKGLVTDVSEILVTAETEEDVERTIARRIGEGSEYEFVWIGSYDSPSETVEVEESAGGDTGFDISEIDLDSPLDGPRAIRSAVEESEVVVVEQFDDYSRPVARPDPSLGACAIVPLTYREATYGVLVVYSGDNGAFDEYERAVLSAIGPMVGSALNAIKSKRTGLTNTGIEVAVEVDDDDFFLSEVTDRLGCRLEFEGVIHRDDGQWNVLCTGYGVDPERLQAVAERADGIDSVELILEEDTDCVVQFTATDVPMIRIVTDRGTRLTGLTADRGQTELRFESVDEETARTTLDGLRGAYDGVELLEYHESEDLGQTPPGFRATVEDRLTERQYEALRKAHVAGFFEWPRPVEGDEIADSMGVVPSTFHQHLRTAERKLVDGFFEV